VWRDGRRDKILPTARFAVGEVRGDVCAKVGAGLNAIMEAGMKALMLPVSSSFPHAIGRSLPATRVGRKDAPLQGGSKGRAAGAVRSCLDNAPIERRRDRAPWSRLPMPRFEASLAWRGPSCPSSRRKGSPVGT